MKNQTVITTNSGENIPVTFRTDAGNGSDVRQAYNKAHTIYRALRRNGFNSLQAITYANNNIGRVRVAKKCGYGDNSIAFLASKHIAPDSVYKDIKFPDTYPFTPPREIESGNRIQLEKAIWQVKSYYIFPTDDRKPKNRPLP